MATLVGARPLQMETGLHRTIRDCSRHVSGVVRAFHREPMQRVITAVVIVLCGCAKDVGSGLMSPTRDHQCTRVEGPAVGALPLEVEVGGRKVRFTEWTMPDALSTEIVGFAAQVPPDVEVTVQAGEQTFVGASSRWLHPKGVSGPGVHGIDALTLCTRG